MFTAHMKTLIPTLILCFVWSISVSAQTPTPSPEASPSNGQIQLKDYRDVLEHERKLLEEQSETNYKRVDALIDRSIWMFSTVGGAALAVFATAAGLFIWQYGRSKREMKTAVREQFKEQAASLIDEEMNSLRNKVESLNKDVRELQSVNEQPITWVYSGTTVTAPHERGH